MSTAARGTTPPLLDRSRLVAALDYDPADDTLLAQAFNHRSWSSEHAEDESNERLEFLGDAVLGFVVADLVYRREAGFSEGALTDIRKALVNSVCLAEIAIELDLGRHLRLGKGEEQSGGREKPSILADAVEAVIGAVYLDAGVATARSLVERLLGERIQAAIDDGGRNQDHKSRFQEQLAGLGLPPARYGLETSGPDHARSFTATVTVGAHRLGTGTGRSKKQAEQHAARAALTLLGPDGAGYPGTHDAVGGADNG